MVGIGTKADDERGDLATFEEQARDDRMVGNRAGIRSYDVRILEMVLQQFNHQQRTRGKLPQALVERRLPRPRLARLDEDDEDRDRPAVEIERMDAHEVTFGEAVDGLARKCRLIAVDGHGGAAASFPSGSLEREEFFEAAPDIVDAAADFVGQCSAFGEAAPMAPVFASVVGIERFAQIVVAVGCGTLEEGPLRFLDGQQRKSLADGDGAHHLRGGAVDAHFGQHHDFRQFEMRSSREWRRDLR